MRGRRVLVPLCTMMLGLAACAADDASSGGTVTGTGGPGTTVAPPAVHTIASAEETYVDASRPTAANGSYGGASDRTVRVRFYFPADRAGAPFPLIVFSHGFTGEPESYRMLLEDFARAGYVVAAPSYPLSHGGAPGGPTLTDLPNQPADASFVIDRVLDANAGDGWLRGLVDPSRIGADGHSLGGLTTLTLAFNAQCNDARVKAAIVMSGLQLGCTGPYFGDDRDPLLVIHGDNDETVPYAGGKQAFEAATGPKYFMTIIGGKHVTEELGGTSSGQRAVSEASIAFFDEYLKKDPSGADRLQQAGSAPGIATLDARP